MADSAFKTQVSRTEDANTASNVLYIQIADNAGNAVSVTGNKLDVNASVTLETAYVDDSAFTIGTDKVNAQGFLADETATDSVDEGDIGLARMTLDRRMITACDQQGTWDIGTVTTLTGITNTVTVDGTVAVSSVSGTVAVTQSGAWTVAATQSGVWDIGTVTTLTGITNDVNIADGGNSITVDAADLDIRDLTHVSDSVEIGDGTDTMAVNTDGSINVVVSGSSGTKVHDYATATPAAGASANNDYTVVGTTFELSQVQWSGSGKMKVEIQVGPVGTLVTKAVGFTEKDTSNEIVFDPVIVVPVTSTGTVRVIMTNRQGTGVDVNSTIMGNDIA